MRIEDRNNIRVSERSAAPQAGLATTMVFMHGFGCDQTMWRYLEPLFRPRYRTVLFDLVGSGGAGHGSTFDLRLPLPTVPREVPAPANRRLLAGTREGKVLVIDDSADAAESLALALDILGYEVRTAYDGPAGIAAAQAFTPRVILLDIGLPHMNGYDVARRLRGEPCGRHAILVAVTGWGQDKDRKMASDAGFDLHLTKPVDFYELDAVLQKMLQAS